MLNWLKGAAAKTQRKNIERTLAILIPAAAEADARIQKTGQPIPADVRHIASLQKSLLADLIGPVPLDELRVDYLTPIEADPDHCEGVKVALRHVFDSAARR